MSDQEMLEAYDEPCAHMNVPKLARGIASRPTRGSSQRKRFSLTISVLRPCRNIGITVCRVLLLTSG